MAWIVVFGLVLVGCVIGGIVNRDDEDVVPPPTATERADTVTVLERSAAAQGVCYGWVLKEVGRQVSAGSNLGDGIPVDEARCPRWVEVVASVNWTPASSEADDSAYVTVRGSDDFRHLDLVRVENGLPRFGLADDVFVAEPGWATTRAAVVLPLLMAERGLVDPAPVPSAAAPSAAAPPLPQAGNDMWRDRWGYFVAATVLLLLATLQITTGFVQRGRRREAAAWAGSRQRRARP